MTRRLIQIGTFYRMGLITLPKYWITSVINAPFYPRNQCKIPEICRKQYIINSWKTINICKQVFNNEQNSLTNGEYHNTKIWDHQCEKQPFFTPGINTKYQKLSKKFYIFDIVVKHIKIYNRQYITLAMTNNASQYPSGP